MAQPLKEIREAAITWLRAKAKAGTSDPEGTNEVIDEFLEEKKELEEAASTGRMNEGAKRMIYAFNSGVETNAQSVIDGADDFDEDRREHLRSVAADIAKRFTPKS